VHVILSVGLKFQEKPQTKLVIEKRMKGHHKKTNKRRRNDEVWDATGICGVDMDVLQLPYRMLLVDLSCTWVLISVQI